MKDGPALVDMRLSLRRITRSVLKLAPLALLIAAGAARS